MGNTAYAPPALGRPAAHILRSERAVEAGGQLAVLSLDGIEQGTDHLRDGILPSGRCYHFGLVGKE